MLQSWSKMRTLMSTGGDFWENGPSMSPSLKTRQFHDEYLQQSHDKDPQPIFNYRGSASGHVAAWRILATVFASTGGGADGYVTTWRILSSSSSCHNCLSWRRVMKSFFNNLRWNMKSFFNNLRWPRMKSFRKIFWNVTKRSCRV